MAQKYKRLSYTERTVIDQLRKQGYGVRFIARALRRSPSTISEELRREGMDIHSYSLIKAQRRANIMRKSLKPKIKMHAALEALIHLLLIERRCSPAQISGYLKRYYPNQKPLHVSHQTIYSYIKEPKHWALLRSYLRRKGKKRRNRKLYPKRGLIRDMLPISERPQEVERRQVPGHWEGDLIIGKNGASAMGTLVERSSRYTIIVPIKKRDSQSVVDAFIKKLKELPRKLLKSLTYDQGSEMAFHKKISSQLAMPVYFANAGSPWQRGSNENTNGLLREFFPKKTDLRLHSEEKIQEVQSLLNKRPRKILAFASPSQVLERFMKQ